MSTEAHYHRLVRGIPQGVYILDGEGRFTEVNESAERILDRPASDLLGRSFRDVMAPHAARPVGEIFQRVITGREDDVIFEASIVRPSGAARTLEITASAIREEDRIVGLYGIARDITDERALLDALRYSEERLREIASNIREVFWIFTPDFSQALYLSPAYESIFRQPPDAVYRDGRAFMDRVHPEDRPALVAAIERVRYEIVKGIEFRLVFPDAPVRWVVARGYPVHDESGAIVRVVGTTTDITERKESELALQESERRLHRILDVLPVGVVVAEQPGSIALRNTAADRIWGGMKPAGPGSHDHYHAWFTETGRPVAPVEWPLARALLHGEEVHGELIDIETFDGRRCTTLHSAVPIRNAAGEITSAVLVHEDVTEARARDAEQRQLAGALEGLSEGICLLTPDGVVVYANETFIRIFGIDRDRIPGLRFADWADRPEVEAEQRTSIRHAMEHGRWSGRIWRRRMSDGQEVPLDVVLGRVDTESDAHLLFGIAQDASADIEREQQLRRAERLASVGTMLSGVAHELNNPLQAILNFAQLLLLDERSPEDREALTVMEREAQRMAKIVSDLKQIARSTQDEIRRTSTSDLNEAVRHVMKAQDYRMRTSNIDVRLDLAADIPPILVDRAQLEQVLVNLVVNAEQAMTAHAASGRLIIRTRASARGASLHIVDNGSGIPPQQLDRIFDPFFTTKAPGEGTGLGLSLVHSIVTEAGGEIRVDSEVGSGTAFRIEWASAAPAQDSPEPPREDAPPSDALRVLVVDDEAALRSVMARYLRRRGHSVDQAADGAAALELLDQTAYDVIVSDLRMPGIGGEGLMERLRERGIADRVIFMTGDPAGAAARLAATGVPVLLKPVELAEVARAVETRASP